MRDKIILVAIIVLGFIMWRGLQAATQKNFKCEYKLIYAVCEPKATPKPGETLKLPTLGEIFKEGIKF